MCRDTKSLKVRTQWQPSNGRPVIDLRTAVADRLERHLMKRSQDDVSFHPLQSGDCRDLGIQRHIRGISSAMGPYSTLLYSRVE